MISRENISADTEERLRSSVLSRKTISMPKQHLSKNVVSELQKSVFTNQLTSLETKVPLSGYNNARKQILIQSGSNNFEEANLTFSEEFVIEKQVDRLEHESIFNESRKKDSGSERYWNGQFVQQKSMPLQKS